VKKQKEKQASVLDTDRLTDSRTLCAKENMDFSHGLRLHNTKKPRGEEKVVQSSKYFIEIGSFVAVFGKEFSGPKMIAHDS
jgi:hypothetical protein